MTGIFTGFIDWIDARLPIRRAWDTHLGKYYAPKNFNFWYFFGVFALFVLINQLITGIWLTMNYVPSAADAFGSVEYIMRDVPYGWLLRYLHSTGASAFFVVIYLHMFRGLMYGSYKAPRELIWIFGMFIYLALMAEAFLGYVLPWGQMSYWGAQVIVNLFGAIPYVGEDLVQWIRGDYLISGATLNRFFALHVVALPIVILALVFLHILALHEIGSNNPDGVEIKKYKDENGVPLDGIRFHPYYTVHDLVGLSVFLIIFLGIVFFAPELNGYFLEHANFEEANNLKTPEHIAPVWYFTPFYAILRAVTIDLGGVFTSKFMGFIAMISAIVVLFFLPWLDRSPVRSIRYKGLISKIALITFAANFVVLGWLGLKAPTPGRTFLSQLCTVLYFAFFIGLPFWSRLEKTTTPPDRIRMKGLPRRQVLAGLALFLALVILPITAVAAGGGGKCGAVPCDTFEADYDDKASLQAGARTFVNYCMGCHSAKYMRWERMAEDLDIPRDLVMDNMMFTDQKIGDLMYISMDKADAKRWFGAMPPDLTLETRARSPEWVLTFLRSYYLDAERPTGVNNSVFANVGMPHVFMHEQGVAKCNEATDDICTDLSAPLGGELNEAEFEKVTYDLTNFLTYMAEPVAKKRQTIGVYVILFLLILLALTWLLNREYWKEVH